MESARGGRVSFDWELGLPRGCRFKPCLSNQFHQVWHQPPRRRGQLALAEAGLEGLMPHSPAGRVTGGIIIQRQGGTNHLSIHPGGESGSGRFACHIRVPLPAGVSDVLEGFFYG